MSAALIKYDAACRAVAECKTVDEVKGWGDKAAAMQAYGRMAKDKTLEIDAAEIRIRAERRLGEMLVQQKAEGGLNKGAQGRGSNQYAKNEMRSAASTAPNWPTPASATTFTAGRRSWSPSPLHGHKPYPYLKDDLEGWPSQRDQQIQRITAIPLAADNSTRLSVPR